MADPRFERTIQLGLLDRLLDDEPQNRSEKMMTRAESLVRFRQAVRRDLEYLLNSTAMPLSIPEACKEAKNSLLTFGLPDIASMSSQSFKDRDRIYRSLAAAITLFEPRLAEVRITSNDLRAKRLQGALTFHIDAILLVDPAPERISFDTVLEISKGSYTVKDG